LQLPTSWQTNADYFAGNDMPEGASQIAQAYAGHQFGHFTMLGDGRALLLGEIETEQGITDVQLKGAGRTPFSRNGDGRAALGPMLREYIISEAMHALHIPTTRSLAVTITGEAVQRETLLEGAILTRTASSHLRVGTFEYARQLGEYRYLQALADYAIARHDADIADEDNKYVLFLRRVIDRQAQLLAKWQCIGFVHGVMNTDNMTISGETIDYGPCAFLDAYDLGAVFSSIDRQGRYAFGNQPKMAGWNIARLAESMLPLFSDDEQQAIAAAQEALDEFPVLFNRYWEEGMRRKIGLQTAQQGDRELIQQLLLAMQQHKADYTETFRALADGEELDNAFFESDAFFDWEMAWQKRLLDEDRSIVDARRLMQQVNPIVIPRNHLVNTAIEAAENGDFSPVQELLRVLQTPYTLAHDDAAYGKGPEDDKPFITYCGT
ncbi:MAG: YdiU family protein, partial [Caryophanon sp.]|nr:YdiU family protein [Caryophanon sp.]